MTQTAKYSDDVESLTINDGGNSWERQRSSTELQGFVERHLSLIGELDPTEYEFIA